MQKNRIYLNILEMLPNKYWDTILDYYPDYYSSDAIAESLDLSMVISGEADTDKRADYFKRYKTMTSIKWAWAVLELRLYVKALENKAKQWDELMTEKK